MPAPTVAPSDQREAVVRLRLAVLRLARRLRQQGESLITPSQHSALASVARHGPLTLGALAAHERVQPPSMTRIVAQLEAAGLLARRTGSDDRRLAYVEVTASGRKLLARNRRRKDAYLATRLAALEPAERERLNDAVPVLERLLEEGGSR